MTRRGMPGSETLRYAIDLAAVQAAAARLAGVAHRTPAATCSTLDALAGRSLFLKCENLQRAGAFKFRGAYNAVASLTPEAAPAGVVTHSSGNHGQALALAARLRGIPAHIVMPAGSARVKVAAVEGYGGRVIECEATLAARESTARRILEETRATFVHPYEEPNVMAGQGTIALELLEQVPDLDAVVAPVGGGGLVSGLAIALRGLAPTVRLFAAEPLGADDAARSMAAGQHVPQTSPKTIADGLRTSLGQNTWPIVRDHVERVLTVSEDEIVAAMRLAWERAKLLIEPSAAVPLAAVLGESFRRETGLRRVAVVLSGGNADLDRLPWA